MERALFAAIGLWITGAGAWVVGAGYALAPLVARPRPPAFNLVQMREDDELSSGADSSAPPSPPASSQSPVLVRPEDASSLLTESQRARLAPINSLKRKRRSRKVRQVGGDSGERFVPLVAGARPTTADSIMASYAGASLSEKREQGEDYWVDPVLLQEEIAAESRRKKFKRREREMPAEKLREELVAPYTNNVIGFLVVGIGFLAVLFSLFPQLLENDLANSVASFPSQL